MNGDRFLALAAGFVVLILGLLILASVEGVRFEVVDPVTCLKSGGIWTRGFCVSS